MTDYAEIDGVKIPRPKGQDIRPRVFNGKPWPFAMIAFSEPTDRYVLWFISNYKYAFNVFYTSDFIQWMKPPSGDKSKWPIYKYQVAVKSLMDRHLIKYGDNKRLTLVLTNKGKLFRLTTHPGWPIIPVLFAALVAFTIFGLNRGCAKEKAKSEEGKSINQTGTKKIDTLIKSIDTPKSHKIIPFTDPTKPNCLTEITITVYNSQNEALGDIEIDWGGKGRSFKAENTGTDGRKTITFDSGLESFSIIKLKDNKNKYNDVDTSVNICNSKHLQRAHVFHLTKK